MRDIQNDYQAMPADFLKLSRKEWRSIIAVATGLYDAKDTPYPKRLQPIQDKLEAMGIAYDYGHDKKEGKHAANISQERAKMENTGAPHNGWEGRTPDSAEDRSR